MNCRFCKREALSDDRVCLMHMIEKANFCAMMGVPDLPCNDDLKHWIEAASDAPKEPLTMEKFNEVMQAIWNVTEPL